LAFAAIAIVSEMKLLFPSFSYQAISPYSTEAESTSISPSPSTSTAKTEMAPIASVVIVCGVNSTCAVLWVATIEKVETIKIIKYTLILSSTASLPKSHNNVLTIF